MKIVAGMGSIDEYILYAQAGVDEIFIGYVPFYISQTYGMLPSVNRREVMYVNVQIGSFSELKILSKMVKTYGVPITIALNGLSYTPEQFPLLKRLVCECMEIGFTSFIIADMALLIYLDQEQILPLMQVHVSGELGEMNQYTISLLKKYGIKRMIFHRKVSLENMKEMIDPSLEYEAFGLNEKCHFHGGFCQSLHCDELRHMCLLPYKMEKDIKERDIKETKASGGCGLCGLYRLQQMGVEYCKLVSRGNYVEDTMEDIELLKQAFAILQVSKDETEYIQRIKKEIFHNNCSNNCYYKIERRKEYE